VKPFELCAPQTIDQAVALADGRASCLMAGGTDLLCLMREGIIVPSRIISMHRIPGLDAIELASDHIGIGALASLERIAQSPVLREWVPVLTQAAHSAGPLQVRTIGTFGGELCQRPRCWYYRDLGYPCKKKGGTLCPAVDGDNRHHAIFGRRECPIVHPSSCAPVLVALGASVRIKGPTGDRSVTAERFFLGGDADIHGENVLVDGEILHRIDVPLPAPADRMIRRASIEPEIPQSQMPAVVVALTLEDHIVRRARIVVSHVAPVPWRAREAEQALVGRRIDPRLVESVAAHAVAGARPLSHNVYKVALVRSAVSRALHAMIPVSPQSG
jgi:xanthine dehydrogenase YagS FAD-binding subunit